MPGVISQPDYSLYQSIYKTMETKYTSIEQQFDAADRSHIITKKKSPLYGAVLLAAGAASTVLVPLDNTESGLGGAFFIVLAVTFFVWGLLATFIRKKHYYHVPGLSTIVFKEFFFESENFYKLTRILETGTYSELAKVQQIAVDKGIKLRIAYTPNRSLCVVQLLKYVPLEYELQSEAKELNKQQATVVFKIFQL